jgi:3-deoxy-D-manno-octulosonate 8-phosphate phosphatase (KDO 8-P phosphatase)
MTTVAADFAERAQPIQLVLCDVDGVLTDGALWYGADGEAFKRFHVRDGLGIVNARKAGLRFVIISGRTSKAVDTRAKELNIELVYQGVDDKLGLLSEICARASVAPQHCAMIGDDLNDLPLMNAVGLRACPADAVEAVRERCHFISSLNGGHGSVRQLLEALLAVKSGASLASLTLSK